MKIVFMGTPEYSAKHLQAIVEAGFNVIGVFSQPDKPAGRGLKLKPTPVKEIAKKYKLPVYQPDKISTGEGWKALKSLNPDVIIVVSYGKILRKNVLELPKFGCFNVHPSLLPRYRGTTPIQRALENGDDITGVTIFKLDEGVDTGPIAMQRSIKISLDDTYGSLSEKLISLGCEMLVEFLEELSKGKIELKPQKGEATYSPKITKEELFIDWSMSGEKIFNKTRAFDPEPAVRSYLNGRLFKFFSVALEARSNESHLPGQIVNISKNSVAIACGDGKDIVSFKKLQPSGKKIMSPTELKNGRLIKEGDVFSSES
ncbi:MAG: methionyl-tRNA formyltransferase [Thermotogaceae bacterium]|jgi:methionyl-tRNA formyltransferase|nr:methionyl-tRNA formyltransferase [Thermotogaceae bacterium]MDN5338079.1 methionyl-tRNA formyltransferase [Thermotogaceae bacterium]